MRLLAIDPGEDIGMSFLDTDKVVEETWQFNISQSKEPHRVLWRSLRRRGPDVVICEDFYHLPRFMKLKMITPELIGVVKLWGQDYGVEVIMQNRGMKQGWPDSKLKKLGLFIPGEDHEDAMDALRHRLVYQEQHNMIDWSKLR